MNKLKEFYNSVGFIIAFMFCCVLISAVAGAKVLNKFLLLVFASQVLLNADKTTALINKFGKTEENNSEEKKRKDLEKYNDIQNGYIQTV